VVFFFSSGSRHTRFDCDWSSDVCSSDLVLEVPLDAFPLQPHRGRKTAVRLERERIERNLEDLLARRTAAEDELADAAGRREAAKIGRASWRERAQVAGGAATGGAKHAVL